METTELTKTEKATQTIQLVKGDFTPSEAASVMTTLIDDKINFHKIQRLQRWENNHNCETAPLDSRIYELQEEKRIALEFIQNARAHGQKVNINGILEITVTE